jgi:hypothetical protein
LADGKPPAGYDKSCQAIEFTLYDTTEYNLDKEALRLDTGRFKGFNGGKSKLKGS